MKKNRISFLSFAVTMVMASMFTCALTSCDNEDNPPPSSSSQTLFMFEEEAATRTSIHNVLFQWTPGDKIWVGDGDTWTVSNASNIAKNDAVWGPQFFFDREFTGESYKVRYTGYANGDTTATYHDKVTIADIQTQKTWNDFSHLGTSGDCALGTAVRKSDMTKASSPLSPFTNTYKFTLTHAASYLFIRPFLHADIKDSYILQKVEIYSDMSNSYIAGEYDFSDAGLSKKPKGDTGKQKITIVCEEGFPLSTTNLSFNSLSDCIVVVIAPGTHQLSIAYTVQNSRTSQPETFIKNFSLREYTPNGLFGIVHEFKNDKTIFLG